MLLTAMNDWWTSLTTPQQIYWGISIVSSVLFTIQFILSLIGLDADADVDFDIEMDTDGVPSFDADFT
ncbi:MAG: hypothetical protein AAGK97_13730, partial [Bacteroidota bacterium]